MRALSQEELDVLSTTPCRSWAPGEPGRERCHEISEDLRLRGCLTRAVVNGGELYSRTELGTLALRVSRPGQQ